MKPTRPVLERAFRSYNRKYFSNLLPNPPEVELGWGDIDCMGYQLGDEIVINRKYRQWGSVWRGTLLHEMAHLKLEGEKVRSDHGKEFQNEMLRLAKAGAFKKIW